MYCTLCVPIVDRATYVLSSDATAPITEGTTFNFTATLNLPADFTLDTTIVLDVVELESGLSSGT